MPTASDELRRFALANFGSLDTALIIDCLERKGFTLTKEFCWKRTKAPTGFEWKCINFLFEEWDFGGYDED